MVAPGLRIGHRLPLLNALNELLVIQLLGPCFRKGGNGALHAYDVMNKSVEMLG